MDKSFFDKVNINEEDFHYLLDYGHLWEYSNIKRSLHRKIYFKPSLGIPGGDMFYYQIRDNQKDIALELDKSYLFISKFLDYLSKSTGENYNRQDLEFINWGHQQLVYVIKINGLRYAVSIGQPRVKYGKIKEEYDNLIALAEKFPYSVIRPLDYFTDGSRELFISPYIYQARCLSNRHDGFGMYVPEPNYRFVNFINDEKSLINSCMIAHLVNFFDEEIGLGIGDFRLSAGDFILAKDWSLNDGEQTLEKMKLIAARKFIQTNLSDYMDLLREEFRKKTPFIMEDTAFEKLQDTNYLVNTSSHFPMEEEEIQNGIQLGLKMRNNRLSK